MYIAKNNKGEIVDIDNVKIGETYYCPLCNTPLIVKNKGTAISHHFAHESLLECDDFSHDMSEWHRNWQAIFPKNNREVVMELGDEKHFADICACGYVIEFQHSPISYDEFSRRNDFYTKCSKKVIWIFDMREQENISFYCSTPKCKIYNWDYWRTGSTLYKYNPMLENDILVFFQFNNSTIEKLAFNDVSNDPNCDYCPYNYCGSDFNDSVRDDCPYRSMKRFGTYNTKKQTIYYPKSPCTPEEFYNWIKSHRR